MKNLFAQLVMVLAVVASRGVAAQEVLVAPQGAGDLPPADALVLPSGESSDDQAGELIPQPAAEGEEEFMQSYVNDPMHMEACPSYFESSGSWLERGYWYSEVDFLMMNRSWDKHGLLFAFDGTTSQAPGFAPGTSVPGFGQILAIDTLNIDGSRPGENPLARVTLGRFLFRDSHNRDHTLEGSYYGGGRWEQNASLNSTAATGLNVNDFIDRSNQSFDGATSMDFGYFTRMDSIEGNYSVKQRMKRDQMELRPSGEWVRVASPTRTYGFLTGVRYMRVTEDLNITAGDIPDPNGAALPRLDGEYNVDTFNNLLGGQLGASYAYETARWSLGTAVKGGAFWNREYLKSNFFVGDAALDQPVRSQAQITDDPNNDLSFVGEFQVLGKWHLRPNVSLRAGFEVLYVSGIALAPHQVNFVTATAGPNNNGANTGYTPVASSGELVGLGSSLGIEIYR